MLAVLFAKEQHFLLIDEPTNHLDVHGRTLVRDYLNKKQGFILVSHDRWFLDGCIDHVLAINKMDILVCQGNFSTWWENKKQQDAFEIAENEKLKGEVKKLEKAAKQASRWSEQVEQTKFAGRGANPQENRGFFDRGAVGHKAAKMMKRSKGLEHRRNQALEEKSDLLKNVETVDKLQLRPLRHHKEVLIRMEKFSLFYGERPIINNLDMEIKNGQRIVLTGANGSGKSSLIKLLLGNSIQTTGVYEMASGLKISYVPQDTSFLKGTLDDFITLHQMNSTLFRTILRKLDFPREQFDKEMSDYSAGQKKKVLLAKSLCEEAHLYVWDEPLNYIDIFSRMQLEELLEQYAPTMLLVEHDQVFVEKLVDIIVPL
jgi:lincosamide and streptogramin A transport system ATP-binding/permease protein